MREDMPFVDIHRHQIIFIGEAGEKSVFGVAFHSHHDFFIQIFRHKLQHVILKTDRGTSVYEIIGGMVKQHSAQGVAFVFYRRVVGGECGMGFVIMYDKCEQNNAESC